MNDELDIGQSNHQTKASRHEWHGVAVLAFIVMEMSWIALWFNLLLWSENNVYYARAFFVLGFIMMGIYYVVWRMNYLGLNLLISRAILFLLLLLSVIAGLETLDTSEGLVNFGELLRRTIYSFRAGSFAPDISIIIVFTLFVCWRAVSLASRHLQPSKAVSSFRTGILMFLGYDLLLPEGQIDPNSAFYIFLFSGLLAMSLTRIAYVGQVKSGQELPYNWGWFGGIIISIVITISVAIFLGSFPNGRLLEFIMLIFSWIGYAVLLLVGPLLWLVIQGMYWVFDHLDLERIFGLLLSAIQTVISYLEIVVNVVRSWVSNFQNNPIQTILTFLESSKPLILLGGILLVCYFIVLAMRRYHLGRRDLIDKDYDSVFVQQDLISLLKRAFRNGLERIMGEIEQGLHLQTLRRLFAAARIRRIYARLMNLSARLDNPRPPSRTPIEFLESLNQLFPTLGSELELVTTMYVRIRYGELPEQSEELEIVEQAWQRISFEGRKMIRTKPRGNK